MTAGRDDLRLRQFRRFIIAHPYSRTFTVNVFSKCSPKLIKTSPGPRPGPTGELGPSMPSWPRSRRRQTTQSDVQMERGSPNGVDHRCPRAGPPTDLVVGLRCAVAQQVSTTVMRRWDLHAVTHRSGWLKLSPWGEPGPPCRDLLKLTQPHAAALLGIHNTDHAV